MARLIPTAAALALAAGLTSLPAAAPAADPPYTVQTLHFKVKVGPARDKVCDIVGDLYAPRSASATNRVPAILTTNGFGGSKDDQAGIGRWAASSGYVVLSYSGLGFGGSGCKITLDDPDWDGAAGSQLVSYLGGRAGIAFTDAKHTVPAPALQLVRRDAKDHNGVARTDDPRVGMIGGSYGGQVQFAVAGLDARVDTIVPIVTWNDLEYALGPNNTDQERPDLSGVRSRTPGAVKVAWGLGFSALGVAAGFEGAQQDPSRLVGCPNFIDWVCPALVTAGVLGFFQPPAVSALRHASVASYVDKIKIPVFLWQGELDTLFNLNEAVATFKALQARGVPVKMIWHRWGHSSLTPDPGEINLGAPDPSTQYLTGRAFAWFEHHLKGKPVSTGPTFAYFRPWVPFTGNAAPAYGTAGSYPFQSHVKYYLSGKALTTSSTGLAKAAQTFLTPPAGVPTTLSNPDVISSVAPASVLPELDLPGTFASWQTAPLAAARNVAGSPVLTVKVASPTAALTQAAGPAGKLLVFVRIQDVDAAGKARDIDLLTAPVRVRDVNQSFKVTLPAFVHRFPAGHRIRLVVAGGSVNYRGGVTPHAVTIATGSAGQVLDLPVVP